MSISKLYMVTKLTHITESVKNTVVRNVAVINGDSLMETISNHQ